ncbi:hypothetical protein HDV63DRAFT_376955 [Trichoderma sp. SZMC 28014]
MGDGEHFSRVYIFEHEPLNAGTGPAPQPYLSMRATNCWGAAGEGGMRSDKDLAASMRNRQRKTTDDARGWRFRSTSYQCELRRVAQVLRNYSYFRCKHCGMHITQIPTFSPRQSCWSLSPGSCPMSPCAWERPSWVNRRFWLPCQRDGRFRSLRRHLRVAFLDYLEKRHGSVDAVAA